jgi:hypothetical protein
MLPPAPNLIGAIRSGFDAVANHILLILFPITLDLLLWFGPRIKLTGLINSTIERLFSISISQDPGIGELLPLLEETWSGVAQNFNMLAFLRSYPVGITSLVAAEQLANSPLGMMFSWELESMGGVFLVFILLSLAGIAGGTLYFLVVAQAAVIGDISWRQALTEWPWASLQIVLLALLWTAVFLLITIPGSFVLSLVMLSGATYGICALILFAGVVFWLILPLVFSPHGIVLNRKGFFESVKLSVLLTRRTLPSTVLFVTAVFLLSKGLDIIWSFPKETSWMLIIGIIGHAFVTTGLLASSFVYYQDALRWMREMLQFRKIKTI